MKSHLYRFPLVSLLLALLCAGFAHAQTSGSLIYNHLDLSGGGVAVQLATIAGDGSGDQIVPVPVLNPYYPVWSRDGELLAVAGTDPARPSKLSTDVFLWRPANGQITRLSAFEDTANASGFITFYPSYLAVSPDAQRVAAGMVSYVGARATIIKTNEFGNPEGPYDTTSKITRCVSLVVLSGNGVEPFVVVSGLCDDDNSHPGEGVDWSPTQDLVAYPINSLTTFDGPGGVQFPITAIHLIEPAPGAAALGRSRQLTFPSGTAGGVFDPVSFWWADDFAPAFSPDGGQVAYVRLYTAVTSDGIKHPSVPSIRIVGVDGSNDHEIAQFAQGRYITRLSWSPDASQLVFDLGQQALRQGFPLRTFDYTSVTLARININGSGLAQFRGAPATWATWRPGNGGHVTPPPVITSLWPTSVSAGSAGFDLAVNGTGFLPGSTILWNGAALPTTLVSATQLRGGVTSTQVSTEEQINIRVSVPGGSVPDSTAVQFTVTPGKPAAGPELKIRLQPDVGNSLVFTWPVSTGVFILESTAKLEPQAKWVPLSATPTNGGGQTTVTLGVSGLEGYFRLRGL